MMSINRYTSAILCLFIAAITSLFAVDAGEISAKTYDGPKENLHIYLLIGQSNMAGRSAFTEEEAKPVDRCFLLNDKDLWEPAKNPFNIYSTIRKGANMQKMNPGYMFAKTMLTADKDMVIGLVANARGGSHIGEWAKDQKFYKEIIRRAQAAQRTGTLTGILWHQGESDIKKPDGYLEKLKTLVENLRTDLGAPNLPFVAGQIIDGQPINDQIAKLPETVPNTGFVSSEGLTGQDRWHFNSESMRTLGTGYAEVMLKLLRNRKK